jgi:hypothetical protein
VTLKGNFSDLVTYDPGDVAVFGGVPYILKKPCAAGVPPTVTLYWERLEQYLANAVALIMGGITIAEGGALTGKVANNLTTTASGKVLDARQGKALKALIDGISPDEKTLVLSSSTASSTKKFAITVDDDGELSVDELS